MSDWMKLQIWKASGSEIVYRFNMSKRPENTVSDEEFYRNLSDEEFMGRLNGLVMSLYPVPYHRRSRVLMHVALHELRRRDQRFTDTISFEFRSAREAA